MSREQLLAMARRNIAHVRAGTIDQAPGLYRVPAWHYYDAARWELEVERIFKRLPILLGFSCEMREPGSYRALEVADTPILLTRTSSGEVRAFLNVCSHRGAAVVPEGGGQASKFGCPYHAWGYDNEGQLLGIFKEKVFGEVDKSCLGLTPLPVAERAGLIFAVPTPNPAIDIDAFLNGYGEILEHLALENCHYVGRQVIQGPNWKIAYDGYLDFYHLPILHKDTFGPAMPSDTLFDAWGPHQRVSMPAQEYLSFADRDEETWKVDNLLGGVWTIFPGGSIADFDAGGKLYMISMLYPGSTPETSVTVQNFLACFEPDDEKRELIAQQMKFLRHVVENEDYTVCGQIQKAVKTGARSEFVFGRNEGGSQTFHRWVQALVDTEDEGLPQLFRAGI